MYPIEIVNQGLNVLPQNWTSTKFTCHSLALLPYDSLSGPKKLLI